MDSQEGGSLVRPVLENADAVARFCAAAADLGVEVVREEPMARHTTFRIGGPAQLFVAVRETEQLAQVAELAASCGLPYRVLGGGSNVLVSDAGVRGLVLLNQARTIRTVLEGPVPAGELPQVVADAGVPLAGLARWAIQAGWSGLEWAVSVPGTVGGAVIGNAGAHGGEISSILAWALIFYPHLGQRVLTASELAFSYRNSCLKAQVAEVPAPPVVLAAGFHLRPGDVAEMNARAEAFLARRRSTQPVEPSAGSVFRNPPGDHAGRLLEAAGLKGVRCGAAQVSPRHANFIVNLGDARATDVLALIDLMRARVYDQFGIELVPEIVFLGDWPQWPPYQPLGQRRAGVM